jgi:hypothetical protein
MSDKLAISAAFSIFAMAAFVLFGGEPAEAPFGPASLETPTISAPALPSLDVKALLR